MILAACLALGVCLRIIAGNPIGQLGRVHLRGEAVLLVLLCAQALIPFARLAGTGAQIAYWSWLATFPVLIVVAWLNREHPGMLVVAVGLALNVLVIGLNGGMPVMADAASAAGLQGKLVLPIGDFIHVVSSQATRLPWLADVLPLPGPTWARFVPSAGDLMLYAGVVAFLAGARPTAAASASAHK